MNSLLQDKIAIVTGGSRGIGRAIVQRFCDQGAKVYFTYLKNTQAAKGLEAELGGRSVAMQCDSQDREGVDAMVASIRDKEDNKVHILVNNAGIAINSYFAMMTGTDWERVMSTNVQGAYHWASAIIRPMMMQREGCILNMASVSGLFGVPGQTAYGASKGAIIAFTRALAAESGAKGIRVNCLVPGFVDTDMTSAIPRPIRQRYMDRIVMNRFGRTEEIANAALFLVSDLSSYMTGQTLVVDGGLSSVVA